MKADMQNTNAGGTWIGAAGAGGYDLRSDTMTTPTASMLKAIQTCTLFDDVMGEDTATNDLETHCAQLAGKEAALFVLSGTMGNQLGLRSLLTQPPYSVLCDRRSHIFAHEAGGVSSLCGAMLDTITPRNGKYLTLEDIMSEVKPDTNVHYCPTRVISLENTLNGMITPLAEVQRISAFARSQGIKMHCDGARLWEVVASGAGSLVDFATCFDTLSLCFSKGLGAPVGSILVGDRNVIDHARWVRKSIGGGLRQPGPLTAAARVALDETFGKGSNGEGGLLKNTHVLAKEIEKMWTDRGGKIAFEVQTNICWLDLEASDVNDEAWVELGRAEGLKIANRLIIHYQIYQNRGDIVPRLERIFDKALGKGQSTPKGGEPVHQPRSDKALGTGQPATKEEQPVEEISPDKVPTPRPDPIVLYRRRSRRISASLAQLRVEISRVFSVDHGSRTA